jgi:type I restriction enzyme M protein
MPTSIKSLTASQDDAPAERAVLDHHLRLAIDILRGTMEPIDGLHLIAALLLYKRLSDTWAEECEAYLLHGEDRSQTSCRDGHRFHIPKGCLWFDVRVHAGGRSEALSKALSTSFRSIEHCNPRLRQIFQDVDLYNPHRFPPPQLECLFWYLDRLDLRRRDFDPQTLGDAFECLRRCFADEVNKRGGGFFTPSEVARLMAALVAPQEHATIYDPVCGSAGLLLETVRHLARAGGDAQSLHLFGQERGFSITRISLLLYEIDKATVERGDCLSGTELTEPMARWTEGSLPLRQFDYVLGNPPFSLSRKPEERRRNETGEPFTGEEDVPGSRSMPEIAFLRHMWGSLADGGKMAVIMPAGILFRGGEALRIREKMLREDVLEAIIGLGSGLFVGTNVAVVTLVITRRKPTARRGKVLMIRDEAALERGRKRSLSEETAARIAAAVHRFDNEPHFSRVVTLEEIDRNGSDLRISRYFPEDGTPGLGGYEGQRSKAPRPPAGSDPGALLNAEIKAAQVLLEQARRDFHLRAFDRLTRGLSGNSLEHPELGPYPKDWQFARLDELLAEDPRSGTLRKRTGEKDVCYVSQSNLDLDGFVTFESASHVELSEYDYSRFALVPGDVLIRRVHGSRCGTGAIVLQSVPAVFASGIIRLRAKPKEIDPLLLLCWIHHPPVQRLLAPMLSTSVRVSINQPALFSLLYPRIPWKEQQALVPELHDYYVKVETAARLLSGLLENQATIGGGRSIGRKDRSRPRSE